MPLERKGKGRKENTTNSHAIPEYNPPLMLSIRRCKSRLLSSDVGGAGSRFLVALGSSPWSLGVVLAGGVCVLRVRLSAQYCIPVLSTEDSDLNLGLYVYETARKVRQKLLKGEKARAKVGKARKGSGRLFYAIPMQGLCDLLISRVSHHHHCHCHYTYLGIHTHTHMYQPASQQQQPRSTVPQINRQATRACVQKAERQAL